MAVLKKTKNESLSIVQIFLSIVLLILPILSPYTLFNNNNNIPINPFILLISVIVLITFRLKYRLKIIKPLVLLWIVHLFLSLLTAFTYDFNISLIYSLLSITFVIFCYGWLISNCNFEIFTKCANLIGLLCCAFLFFQAICLAMNINPPSGRLFNLKLLNNVGFVETTWGFRLNSFFQEPSYFAIYILPILAVNLEDEKYFLSIIYFISLILSSSSLGIIGSVILVLYYILIRKKSFKFFIIAVISLLIIHLVLYNSLEFYHTSLDRSIDKLLSISTSNIRLTGHIGLFGSLPFANQIIGVGINQMQNYFHQGIGYGIDNYSNSFVITLINTGIIGFIAYIIFIFDMFKKTLKSNRLIYFIVFLVIASVDYFIYNYFFFYILIFYFCSESRIKNESTICDITSVGNKFISHNK